jgi:hypothetical protein
VAGLPAGRRRDFAEKPTGSEKPAKTLNFKDSRRESDGKEVVTAE